MKHAVEYAMVVAAERLTVGIERELPVISEFVPHPRVPEAYLLFR